MKILITLSFLMVFGPYHSRCLALPADSLAIGGWLQSGPSNNVLIVKTTIPGEALDLCGVIPYDKIIGCDDNHFNALTNNLHAWFKNYCYNSTNVVNLIIERQMNIINCPYQKKIPNLSKRLLEGNPLFNKLKLEKEYAALQSKLIKSNRIRHDQWHSPLIDNLIRNPANIIPTAQNFTEQMISKFEKRFIRGHAKELSPSSMPDFIVALSNACLQVIKAYPSRAQIELTISQLPILLNQIDKYFYLQDDPNRSAYIKSHQVIKSALKYDHPSLEKAFKSLEPWFNCNIKASAFRSTNNYKSAGCSGKLLAVYSTPWGDVVIGDVGNNSYNNQPLVIFDLAGNDKYSQRAGKGYQKPVSITYDIKGNDFYCTTNPIAIGAGVCAIGVVIDKAGNDLYSATTGGLGAGFFGIGVLADYAGDDRYMGQRFVQGVAMFGKGLLIDTAGNDTYTALRFSQAVGLPGGSGCIYDKAGDDLYFSSLGTKSSYGTTGIYSGMSQGFGIGLRLIAAGGIGTLIDLKGNDRYESANFSQGGGYYLGTGILYDKNGNDIYNATRYCQAFAAHSGAGVLIDLNGDDTYQGAVTANQGLAWDCSVVGFLDGAGNDQYNSVGLALGAACINSYAQFIDLDGTDRYDYYPNSAAGHSRKGKNDTNIGIFIDAGHKIDLYNNDTALNNCLTNKNNGIFIDQ